jgi:hypothetical protein
MDPYRTIALLRTNQLTVTKRGWIHPCYQLTDGQFCYGKLKYTSWTRRGAWLETFDGVWRVSPKSWLSQSFFIWSSEGEKLGEVIQKWWSCKMNIVLKDNFEAAFTRKKFFSKSYTLANDQAGEILKVDQKYFNFKRPLTVTFEPNLIKTIPNLPLLMLLGVQLVLFRQAEAAAAATV